MVLVCLGSYETEFEDIPIQLRHGIDMYDLIKQPTIAVNKSVDEVSSFLSDYLKIYSHFQNIYLKEIEILPFYGALVFRIKHHNWTLIQSSGFQESDYHLNLNFDLAKNISLLLNSDVVFCDIQGSTDAFVKFDLGKVIEGGYFSDSLDDLSHKMSYLNDYFPSPSFYTYDNSNLGDYLDNSDGSIFDEDEEDKIAYSWIIQSKLEGRNLDLEMDKPHQVFDYLFLLNRLYIPSFRWRTFGLGEKVIASIQGLDDTIDRMDYLLFYSKLEYN